MTSSVTEAIVLKNTNYRDADRLYTLFTRELGKVSAVARGVRKITSKRSGNLDTLNLVTVKLVKDSRGYYAVDEVKTINSYKNVKRDLEFLKKGYYVLEFIHRLVEESHPFDELFDVTKKTLSLLASPSFAPDLSINFFEIKFLSLMGYEMSLTKCIVCERSYNSSAQNWVNSRFSYALGGLVCDDCSSKAGSAVPISCAEVLNKLANNIFPSNVAEKDAKEADKLVKTFLGQTLDVRFRSLEI